MNNLYLLMLLISASLTLFLVFFFVKHLNKKKYLLSCLYFYLASTFLVVDYMLFIICFRGVDGLEIVLRQGPFSNVWITVFYVSMSWLLIGSVLFLLLTKVINKKNILPPLVFYLFSFGYLNILRERILYGDVSDYIKAAHNLYFQEPLHARYLYPPFWATCLQPLVPFGEKAITAVLMGANFISLLIFFVLLFLVLKKFGFSKNLSVIAVFLLLSVNVPILRTMFYVQVNIHVMNLILLSLILYEKNKFFSALALGLAIHLKVSPAILVLPFILKKDWKWIIHLTLVLISVVVATSLMNSFDYYLDFLSNLKEIYRVNFVNFRENSIDSFFRSSFLMFNFDLVKAKFPILLTKILFFFAGMKIMFDNIRKKIFYDDKDNNVIIYNSCIALLFLMLILSPLVWEHHFVLIIFPFLVMLKKLSTKFEVVLYLTSYYLLFLVPTFDFYPWSYSRLLGLIICFILLLSFAKRKVEQPKWFTKMNMFATNLEF